MSIRNILFATAFALASLGATRADGLRPVEAKSIDLGEVSGVAYYTVERDGFHVVATLAQGEADYIAGDIRAFIKEHDAELK